MATATYPSERFYAAGVATGSAWGTAVAVGAAKGVFILKDGGLSLKQKYIQNDEIDQIMAKGGTLGPVEAIDFAPEFALRYDPGMLGSLIASLFGTAGTPSGTAPTGYTHLFPWADEYAKFFTFAIERPGHIWEVASCVPHKLSIKVNAGFMHAVVSLRGNNLIDSSATNTDTQMAALTYVDTGHRIRLSECVLRMNLSSGAALSGSDALDVSEIELDFERPMDALPFAGTIGIGLPKENAFSKITVKIKLPRASAANVLYLSSIFQAEVPQKMDITFTGGVIATTYHYAAVFSFQRLILIDPPAVPLDKLMTTTLTFEAQEAAAAPTGMAGVRPSMGLVNLQATDYLA